MPDLLTTRRSFLRHPAAQYAFALFLVALTTGVREMFNPFIGDRLPYLFYFVAVVVVSLSCRLGPALLTLLSTALAANYLFLEPFGSLSLTPRGVLFTLLYLASGATIIYAGQKRRRSAVALQEQKDWLHTTLVSIGDAVIATDAEGRITLMNPVAEKLTEWTFFQAEGHPLSEVFRIINEQTRATAENPVDKVRRLNRVVGLANHTLLIARSGREVAIDDSGAPIFAQDGSLAGIILVFRDVTEQRARGRALRASEERLRLAHQAAHMGAWQWDIPTGAVVWSDEVCTLHGIEPGSFDGRFESWLKTVHPDDHKLAEEAVQKTLAGGDTYAVDYRTLLPDGRVMWTAAYGHLFRDDAGQPQRLVGVCMDVTGRKEAERQLAEQQGRLAGIIASAMDAIITVNEAQRILVFNRAAEQIFCCSADEALGQPLDRFIPERFRAAHRQHIEGFGHTGVTGRSMSRPGTLWAQRSNGEEFPIEATISQVQAGAEKLFTVVLRDVTERKAAEDKLAEQASLLELTSDAIMVRDEAGRIAYWNRGAQDLYGWTPDEARGKITHELLRTVFPQPREEIDQQVRRSTRWQGELVHTRQDGTQLTVLSRWVSMQHAPGARTILEINTDVTRRKQLETALQSNERLALAGRLSATIAHEIHNPLDAVGNVLFLLEQRLDGSRETRELIAIAQNEVQRVTEISRNMLSLHRESRNPSPVRLAPLLEGVVALVEETIAKGRRRIEVVHGFAGEIEAFPVGLRQVFTNVIKNAIEATPQDGEIRIQSEPALEGGQEGVVVRVSDNGPGIPEEVRSRLFNQPFVSTKAEGGTGLGLWVSASIVAKHGGSIRLERSEPGRGATVSVFLPRSAVRAADAGPRSRTGAAG